MAEVRKPECVALGVWALAGLGAAIALVNLLLAYLHLSRSGGSPEEWAKLEDYLATQLPAVLGLLGGFVFGLWKLAMTRSKKGEVPSNAPEEPQIPEGPRPGPDSVKNLPAHQVAATPEPMSPDATPGHTTSAVPAPAAVGDAVSGAPRLTASPRRRIRSIILWMGVAVILLTVLRPPWVSKASYSGARWEEPTGWHSLFSPPEVKPPHSARIDWDRLFLIWIATGVVVAVGLYTTRGISSPPRHKEDRSWW